MKNENMQFASAGDIASKENVYLDAFPAEMRDEAKKRSAEMKRSGEEYSRVEEAGDVSLAYILKAMRGPDAELMKNPMACMAIGRIFRSGRPADWEKYRNMTPRELIQMDAAACGGQA